ncbi:uncharacterized protein LOC105428526 isoform X2 [Pogonomyrmex barbatus]|uniref:Uncharacterized protein LOC105428526 isoform X2 n=1 Tax=Pogonomyrmex barbatus TaxID=144034 RepID=A0A6I9WIN4_9HYME|nr:uncharacterized protein LOC105428526 isoform X2 [Pogonomyrmex barbatus]
MYNPVVRCLTQRSLKRPNRCIFANIEKRKVSLFSDWFCERHAFARASLTLTPGTARAGKVRSYSSRRRSLGWIPSRISDLISDLRVSILSGDSGRFTFVTVPTCNTGLFLSSEVIGHGICEYVREK